MGLKKFRKGAGAGATIFLLNYFFNIKWMSWNRPSVLLCGTLQKWWNVEGCLGQLAGVRAARMDANDCRLSLSLPCVFIYKEAFCVMAFFFSCCCIHTSHCKSSFIFRSVDLDIIISFQKQEKKTEHLCLLPICYTFARFVAGLQSSVSNPRTPFVILLECLPL